MKTYLTLSAIALAAAATLSSGAVMAADPAPAEIPAITITPNIGIGIVTTYSVAFHKTTNKLLYKAVLS